MYRISPLPEIRHTNLLDSRRILQLWINIKFPATVSTALRLRPTTRQIKITIAKVKVIRPHRHHQVIRVKVIMARVKVRRPVMVVSMVPRLRQVIKVTMVSRVKVLTMGNFLPCNSCPTHRHLLIAQRHLRIAQRHRHHCQEWERRLVRHLIAQFYKDNPHSIERKIRCLPL